MQTKIDWFEIPSSDFARAVQFYETIFGSTLKVEQFGGTPMGVFAGQDGSVGCVIHSELLKPNENGPLIYLDPAPGMDTIRDRIGRRARAAEGLVRAAGRFPDLAP